MPEAPHFLVRREIKKSLNYDLAKRKYSYSDNLLAFRASIGEERAGTLANEKEKELTSQRKKNVSQDKRGADRQKGRKPTARQTVLASFVFVLFLLLSSFLLVFWVFRDNRDLDGMLREIDQIQRLNVATLKLYRSVAKKAQNERDYLRIIKRAYQIQDEELCNKYLLALTALAIKNLPGSENLWGYRISALLDSGMFLEAVSASENLEGSHYLPLKGEILVRSLAAARKQYPDEFTESKIEGLSIANVVQASPYSAATYINLARLFNQPRFAWNAALLYILNGEKSRALSLVRELQEQPWLNHFAASLIAYDNQDWQLAGSLLERKIAQTAKNLDAETSQYLADTYAFREDYEKVIDILNMAIGLTNESIEEKSERTQVVGTWELYYNLAAAYRELGQNNRAFEVLLLGRNVFPYASELLLLLNMVAPPDEREYAKSMLTEFISKDNNEQPYLILASLIFEEKWVNNQRKFGSKLWGLFSKFPHYIQIFHYLLWYYIGLNQVEEVDLALERYWNLVLVKENKDYPNWAKEYMAINTTLKRDFSRAQSLFHDLVADEQNWRVFYNMANTYIYQADFPTAVGQLRKALEFVKNTEDKIDIYYRMMMLAEVTKENYLSVNESIELNNILRAYVLDNYRIHSKHRNPDNDILYIKLDNLLLWRKINDSEFLDDPDAYRKEAGGDVSEDVHFTVLESQDQNANTQDFAEAAQE